MRLHRGLLAVPSTLLALSLVLTGLHVVRGDAPTSRLGGGEHDPAGARGGRRSSGRDCNAQIQPLIADQPGSDRDLTFECGTTEVPISYDEPRGATLPLFLVRAVAGRADRPDRLADGQPGRAGRLRCRHRHRPGADACPWRCCGGSTSSASTLAASACRRPSSASPTRRRMLMVAAEPRPVTDEQLDETFALTQEIADGCAEEYGDALGTFNTVDTARDMDQLRQALGDEQLTYLGYSYGTTLGSTYAELFPDKVRALVLDAAVDPDDDPRPRPSRAPPALEAGFDAFAANCVGLIAGCPIGADPRGVRRGAARPGAQTPIPSSRRTARRERPPRASCSPPSWPPCTTPRPGRSWPRPWPRRRTATRPGCSPWPTATPAGSRTARTRTCSTPTSRSTAPTPTPTSADEDEVRDARRGVERRVPAVRRRVGHSGSTPARPGRPSARPCRSATPRAARRSSSWAPPATR